MFIVGRDFLVRNFIQRPAVGTFEGLSHFTTPWPALGSLDEPTGPKRGHEIEYHSHAAFPAVLLAWAPVVSLEFFEFGTDRKLTALVRHDDPIRFSRLLRRCEA